MTPFVGARSWRAAGVRAGLALLALLAAFVPYDPPEPPELAAEPHVPIAAPAATRSPQVPPAPPLPPLPPDPPCPDDMALAGAVCIDRFEAHLVVELADGTREPWPHNRRPPANRRYLARAAQGAFPQAYVNQLEAARACANAGKRLCRLDEWLRACTGPRATVHPYGDEEQPGRCNTGKPHLMAQLFGNKPERWSYDRHLNNPLLATIEGYLAPSGTHDCASPEGVHDPVGNLHEWVADRVTAPLARRILSQLHLRRPQPWQEGNGIFVGGFFSTSGQHGPGCHYVTIAHRANYHDYSTGFRCCADPR